MKLTAQTKKGQKLEVEIFVDKQNPKIKATTKYGNVWFGTVQGMVAIKMDNEQIMNWLGIDVPQSVFVKIIDHDAKHKMKEMEKEVEKARKEIYNSSPISLSYYYGDWYRVNSLFQNDNVFEIIGQNPFQSKLLNQYATDSIDYADMDKIKKKLAKFFGVDLGTDIKKFKEKYPELKIETNDYDDMRGTGTYIGDIVFENMAMLEKYILKAFLPEIQRKIKAEKEIEDMQNKAIKKAKEIGENVTVRCVGIYDGDVTNPGQELGIVKVYEVATPEGKIKNEETPTY